jgi:hypothetical protein
VEDASVVIRRAALLLAAVAMVLVPSGALAAKAPPPQKQVKRAFALLILDTRRAPKSAVKKRHRTKLLAVAKRARRQANRRRPCKALKTLRAYNRGLRRVRKGRIPGDVPGLASFRGQLRADMLRVSGALLQHPRARRCGGAEPSKVTETDVRVLRSDENELRLRLRLPAPTFAAHQVGGREFQQMFMEGMGETGAVGDPGLPQTGEFYGVPQGADVDIDVTSSESYTLPNVQLYPHQEDPVDAPVADGPNAPDEALFENKPFEQDARAYRQDRNFPARAASGDAVGNVRDLRVGDVNVAGGQYNPATDELKVFTSIDVTVNFAGNNAGNFGGAADFLSPWNAHFQPSYDSMVLNYAAVRDHLIDVVRAPYCGNDMLIITSPELQPAANAYRAARQAAGFSPRVVLTGAGAGRAGTTNTEIAAFIEERLTDDACLVHPEFVILFGNTAHVPTFLVPCSDGGEFQPDPDDPSTYCDIASDLPYSLVGADPFADVMLGRIPAANLDAANAVVTKLTTYQTTPPAPDGDPFYRRSTVTGYWEPKRICVLNEGQTGTPNCDGNNPPVTGHKEIDYTHKQETRGFTKTSDTILRGMQFEGYSVDRLWTTDDEQVDPEKYYDGTPIPESLQRPAFGWDADTEDFLNAYNDGRFVILHRDHGWPDGWADPTLHSGHVPLFTNGAKQPVVMGVNCSSAAFDNPAHPSFVELQVMRPDGGAIAGFGDTRVSPTWPNNHMALGFFDALFPTTVDGFGSDDYTRRLGDVLLSGKNYMAAQNSGGGEYVEHYLYHLLGDPSMQMWARAPYRFEPPRIITEYRDIPVIDPGDPPFQVFVEFPIGAGEPPALGTIATLFSGGDAIGRAVVGADGKAVITPDDPGVKPSQLTVAFDQKDTLPATDTVDQAPQGQDTTMTIQCPQNVTGPGTRSVTGALQTVPAGTSVSLRYEGPNGQVATDTVQTNANGGWTDRQAFSSGQWTVTATFAGDSERNASTASCQVSVP